MRPRPHLVHDSDTAPGGKERRRVSLSARHLAIHPTDLYVHPPKDGKTVSLRIDGTLKHQIDTVVASKKLDYDTAGDLMRAALHLFVEKVIAPRMDEGFARDVQLLSSSIRNQQRLRRVNNVMRLVEEHASTIKQLQKSGAKDLALESFDDLIATIEEHPEPMRTVGLRAIAANSTFTRVALARGWEPPAEDDED